MFYTLVILAIIVCVLLALIILIQEPKGGGLTSGFAGSNNIMGVQRTGDILEKGTWILTISLMVIVLLINVVIPKGGTSGQSGEDLQNQINKPATSVPAAPALPGATPKAAGDTSKR
ncbi:preprotein translocase subunit SecG [Pedobacter sp. SYSU D00535]|uniref:preprotein translocase subunit SecG n=1 Tax=Pedobacter sp. SYSU D00535 TaxID=2810308 RepID=UPI001A96F6EF|nr:preprotein translocase subunit SecG [Pedobacter sp. SYSU D00535]